MYNYTIYGLKIRSDIDFPQLIEETSDKDPDIIIQTGTMPDFVMEHDNESTASIQMDTSWLVNKTMRMVIKNGTTITYSLKPGKNELYLRAYLLGYGLSIVCLQRNVMTIHCSALVINGKAYLISGESGSGKSTLTGNLLKNNDTLFLADDVTAVYKDIDGTVYAEPAFPYQKLCRDAALAQGHSLEELIYVDEDKDKFLVPCKERFCYSRVPIGGMIYLYPHKGSSVVCADAIGIQIFQLCTNNLFLRNILGNDKYAPYIGQKCLELASGMNACTIGRPSGINTIEEIIDKANEFINRTK